MTNTVCNMQAQRVEMDIVRIIHFEVELAYQDGRNVMPCHWLQICKRKFERKQTMLLTPHQTISDCFKRYIILMS